MSDELPLDWDGPRAKPKTHEEELGYPLKPCPFCGSEMVYIATRRTTCSNSHIYCAGCGMSFRGENWNARYHP